MPPRLFPSTDLHLLVGAVVPLRAFASVNTPGVWTVTTKPAMTTSSPGRASPCPVPPALGWLLRRPLRTSIHLHARLRALHGDTTSSAPRG